MRSAEAAAEALGVLRTPSLFGGRGVVLVRRAEALGDQAQEAALAAARGPTGGVLVLVARSPDMRRRLFAQCVRAGAAFEFAPPRAELLPGWAVRLARERGQILDPEAAEVLAELVGQNLGSLAGEVDKLSLYVGAAGRRSIGVDDVKAVAALGRSRSAFELADRLAARDAAGVLRLLQELLGQGEVPVRLLALVAARLRRLLEVAELRAKGVASEAAARRLGLPPWLFRRLEAEARRFTARDLERALFLTQELDLRLKSSRTAPQTLLTGLVLEVCAPKRLG